MTIALPTSDSNCYDQGDVSLVADVGANVGLDTCLVDVCLNADVQLDICLDLDLGLGCGHDACCA